MREFELLISRYDMNMCAFKTKVRLSLENRGTIPVLCT